MLDKVGRIHRIYFKSDVKDLELIEDRSILLVFEFEKKRYTRECKVRFIE